MCLALSSSDCPLGSECGGQVGASLAQVFLGFQTQLLVAVSLVPCVCGGGGGWEEWQPEGCAPAALLWEGREGLGAAGCSNSPGTDSMYSWGLLS